MTVDFAMQIPNAVSAIISALSRNGYDAYVVGGCVRDTLLGNTPHDWDICTSAEPEETMRILKTVGFGIRTAGTHIKHGTVVVYDDCDGEDSSYEVTTFRKDGEYDDFRYPSNVSFTNTIEEDLLRRDFTINAMAYNPQKGLVDPYNGTNDLKMRLIRCVGDPDKRFHEDPLRILRAMRFAAVLQFSIAEDTENAMFSDRKLLCHISPERERDELCKMLMGNSLQWTLTHYSPIIGEFIPEWVECVDCEQYTPWHIFGVGEHIAVAVEKTPKDLTTRLAAFFHDFGKPCCRFIGEDGRYHFHGHGKEGAAIAENIMRRLRFDNKLISDVTKLVEVHDRTVVASPSAVRKAIALTGYKNFMRWMDLRYADVMAQSSLERTERILKIATLREMAVKEFESQNCMTMKDLAINGKDLMDLGYEEGPQIGKQLKTLLDMVIEMPEKNTRMFLLEKSQEALRACG